MSRKEDGTRRFSLFSEEAAVRRIVGAIGPTLLALSLFGADEAVFHPDIPNVWDDRAVETMEVPLAQRDRSPRYMTSAEYYLLKVRPIYRSYPAYAKGREPVGYLESLKEKEPEIIFDPAKLHTKEDWIQAGKLVFEAETQFRPAPAARVPSRRLSVWGNSLRWYTQTHHMSGSLLPAIHKHGVIFWRYMPLRTSVRRDDVAVQFRQRNVRRVGFA